MKTTVVKSLIAVIVLGASVLSSNGQALSAVSTATGHKLTVNSTESYLELENAIATLGARLHDAYIDHPNLQFQPAYGTDGEIIGYLVTGAGSAKQANAIAQILVELDVLGSIASTVDTEFLPVAMNDRVSKRDAR